MDGDDKEALFEACVFDACAIGLNMSCTHLEQLAEYCLAELGIDVGNWRFEYGCRKLKNEDVTNIE